MTQDKTTASPSPTTLLIIGAECTGKSTLMQAFCQRYHALGVSEYMRSFLDAKPSGYLCQFDDIMPIAAGQRQREQLAYAQAKADDIDFVIYDTSPILVAVYSQWYFGRVPDELWALIRQCHYDHVFVTDAHGIDWVADGQRDLPHGRHLMRDAIIQMLQKLQINFTPITGTVDKRLMTIAKVLNQA